MNQDTRHQDIAIIRGEAGEPSRILADFIQEQEEGFYGANPTPKKAINIRKEYIKQIEALVTEVERDSRIAEVIDMPDIPHKYKRLEELGIAVIGKSGTEASRE